MMISQITQFLRRLPSGRHALAIIWKAAGWWIAVWGVLLVGQGLIPAGLALLLRTLVNRLVSTPGWSLSCLRPSASPAYGSPLWLCPVPLPGFVRCKLSGWNVRFIGSSTSRPYTLTWPSMTIRIPTISCIGLRRRPVPSPWRCWKTSVRWCRTG